MTLRLSDDVLLDIADIFDEFTPQNKIDRAVLIIRKRYAGNHNFWPGIADNIRQHVKFEQTEELLEIARAEQFAEDNAKDAARVVELLCSPKPEAPPIPLGEPTKVFTEEREDPIIKEEKDDDIIVDPKPEFTLKRTRQKRTKPEDK